MNTFLLKHIKHMDEQLLKYSIAQTAVGLAV